MHSEVYIDRVIESGPEQLLPGQTRSGQPQPYGRRTLDLGLQYYTERGVSDLREGGLLVDWRRETAGYGDLGISGTLRGSSGGTGSNDFPAGRFTLYQHNLVLQDGGVVDNAAGVLRTRNDPLLSNSFRNSLPSSLLVGVQTWMRHGQSDVFFSAGRLGVLSATQVQGFETTAGRMATLGYSRNLSGNWRAGGQLVRVQGAENVADHSSLLTAARYDTPSGNGGYQAHLLASNLGGAGVWMDGDNRAGRWRHRYGLFRFSPDLVWTDAAIVNDQQGVYLRSDYNDLRYTFAGGIDIAGTDIEQRADRAAINFYNAFASLAWRADTRTSIGGTFSMHAADGRDDLATGSSGRYTVSGYGSRRYRIGTTRVQLETSLIDTGVESGHGFAAVWDQDWKLRSNLELSTTLSHEIIDGISTARDRSTAALLLRHTPIDHLAWGGQLSWASSADPAGSDQTSRYASLFVNWRLLPDLVADLRLMHNRFEDSSPVAANNAISQNSMLLTVTYHRQRGTPIVPVGNGSGKGGYGEITGQAFYDENGDGRRQANERVITNAYVYLDRSYDALTDSDGQFRFRSVAAGTHTVRLAVEDLPLPWGLLEETPREISVTVRGQSVVEFAVQRLNQ